jgi:hypothetical protein
MQSSIDTNRTQFPPPVAAQSVHLLSEPKIKQIRVYKVLGFKLYSTGPSHYQDGALDGMSKWIGLSRI